MEQGVKFSAIPRRPQPALILLIAVFHLVAVYGLARAFAPDITHLAQDSVLSAFTFTQPEPNVPPPETVEAEPDEGAAGDAGKEAVPKPVIAPPPKIPLTQETPAPTASATGSANASGAKEDSTGTGAAGEDGGTGSGRSGGGMGGIVATKPEHISGSINNARDYPIPEGGRQARRGNEVIVKVIIGTDGRARNCRVYRASADHEADRLTCQLVMDRLRFKPARDENGIPVAAPFYWRQRWF